MKHILLIFACFILASCSGSNHRQPMLASTKAGVIPKHKVLGKVEDKSCNASSSIMLIPITSSHVDFKKMYGNIQDQVTHIGGDAVIDFQLRDDSRFHFIIPILFSYMQNCYSVSGTAVKFIDSGSSAWDAAPPSVESGSSVWDVAPPGTKEQEIKSTWD